MHLFVLERWSRGSSAIHRRDPRAKAGVLLVFLIVVATSYRELSLLAALLLVLLMIVTRLAGLPLGPVLLRSAIVLTFTVMVALAAWLAGDPERAVALILKSYLSAVAVFLLVATTPVQVLLRGLAWCGVPRLLLLVAQFLYRYLFVVLEQAGQMRTASRARGGTIGFRGAASAVAALFARSHQRAEDIHRAMLSRGFVQQFHTLETPRFRSADAVFLLGASVIIVLVRAAVDRVNG